MSVLQPGSIPMHVIQAPASGTPKPKPSVLAYLYFVRFSILIWLSMPLLAVADRTGAAALTRGILALENGLQLMLASFFIAMSGWIALLAARIVCAYGEERFRTPPPKIFTIADRMSHWAFWLAQAPGLALLIYVVWITHYESLVSTNGILEYKLSYPHNIFFCAVGVVTAFVCWCFLAGIYYWLFWNKDPRDPATQVNDKAKAFLVPYKEPFDRLSGREPSSFLLVLLELGRIPAKLGEGFRNPDRSFNPLHSGHAMSLLVLGFLLTVYGVFWDFTSPVPIPAVHSFVLWAIMIVASIWVAAALIYHSKVLRKRQQQYRAGTRAGVVNALLMLLLFSPILYVCSLPLRGKQDSSAMPVLASVLVLLLFINWGLAGLAFLLDRFRVPVLLFLVLLGVLVHVVIPKLGPDISDHSVMLAHPEGEAESYAQLKDKFDDPGKRNNPPLKIPSELFAQFEAKGQRPVIIVTSTGGGIHAAAWTSEILAALEREFRDRVVPGHPGAEFHNSILLMSTVSGGSVGTVPWAAEYLRANDAFSDKSLEAMRNAVADSSLQAVAWGLTYADFLRVVYPYKHLFSSELETYDRGWALQQAFWRNRKHAFDGVPPRADTEQTLADLTQWNPERPANLPAFSFNTTVAETGDRFLVANYMVPPQSQKNGEITPADSFLRVYHADLPLSSAARMSANFPYVSPMPRVSLPGSHYHFGDGGYYDNDGTASALEFLKNAQLSNNVPILLIEIRDGGDIDSSVSSDDLTQQNKYGHDWGGLGQLAGPPTIFWNANHVSVTRRNRRELCFLEGELAQKTNIQHLVFDYDPWRATQNKRDAEEPHALSWHLTKRELSFIRNFAESDYITAKTKLASAWFNEQLSGKTTQQQQRQADGCSLRL